ncbi:atrial natriuretic peptide receptor 1 isoform X1 [Wyeomyia smithii]|uniref:atrial natriuretic peptide receptor 1 isoform X1 n=1 Tax=Wyeomyia smithii TaxID=174621 RepID=UPI002467C73E|nr:atrial natriuretic peptide receptor 1 isoform X1 [Wyeomyia smithii]XP_055547940.1 atrial natriuretic peptide receptor 1 isoform X1 [Wyeomyia smithii]XP_055547941.1 atrial natriuretic peptide receptor 1 isoform X1 [Wyeomyia smithii]XP_055547942.1 atrial natriuretic peptide receptor 1 isoform X1 [Wyeomyia smithii]XP_055547943.1 atrial natriuretic peptide receptor 1 isoform X1 [Wyeomyia smithii]XP_055547944.1 atrial natriuretic peptide receptor 1 isoform X1 [Wyeomyia smithii]XP_055547945.1 at
MYRRPMCASVILILCEYCALSNGVRNRPAQAPQERNVALLLNNLSEVTRDRSDEAFFEEDDLRAMMANNGTSSDSSNNDGRIHKRAGGVMNRIEVQKDEGDGNYTTFNVGVLMASHLDSPFDLERCGPAVDLALEKINEFLLKSHNIKLTKVQASYASCSGATSPGLAADMHFKHNVIAFIGPACAFALEPVARLADYWNTPIITGMGDQPPSEGELSVTSGILGRLSNKWKNESTGIFKDKSKYQTLTRMSYCQCRLKLVFSSIFRQFGWRHIALLLDRSDLFSLTVGKNLEYGLKEENLLTFVRELDGNDEEDLDYYLRDASMYARVIILSVRGSLVRKFMLSAHRLGMTRGEFTFLDVEIFQNSYWGDHYWELNDEDDQAARKAYEALLRVSLLQPTSPTYQDFAEKVRQRAKRDYNYSFVEDEEVNFFSGAFYDGVYLLGMALNETLNEDGDIHDGTAITRKMWDRSFLGITGTVRIDDNGDRDADYSILDLDPITGRFEVVAHYYGRSSEYSPVWGKRIHWPGGREGPPPDVPKCGFLGTSPSCQGNEMIFLYGVIGFGIISTFAAAVTYILCKQMKLNNELNNMSWRVRPDEVLLEVGKLFGSKTGLQKLNYENFSLQQFGSSGRASIASGNSQPPAQLFTTIGIYKGERVAIKKVAKKKVYITSTLLWEIKQARDVSHENTVRFVGACIDLPRPTILILTEYCPKGSLKDVLENEAIQLDWNFRMSLIHDVVKGMAYLHNSDVGVHGKLRSCNCLIDGRFVLKISDFGLRTLTTPSELMQDQNYYNKYIFPELLWVAPELLPATVIPGTPATQKGDVYSFAVILEEIVVRGGPYETARQFMDPQHIVERVVGHEDPPFRPFVGQRDCPPDLLDLMEKCWSDSPDDRPTFVQIRAAVKLIMKGFCENLMDDLLRRMEQYANNLESLVEEKTEQLSMEKRRTEELLYQVLPRPVAQQLLAGEMVQPEQFECVTIYFSDIVGFTALCAQSRPMEVVDFLNDLYSTFDRIIGFYDVYKVETIGDAYMVVSGLPERNGHDHAREIGLMSLAVLDAVKSFTIKHKPDQQLKIRIGIHSGPVCAGVVGQKMPHYCLFGDTVNTASRMESTGHPLKIHVSEAAKHILDKFGTFRLELRGEVELKGKGIVTTFWLVECSEPDLRPPTPMKVHESEVPFPILFPGIGK